MSPAETTIQASQTTTPIVSHAATTRIAHLFIDNLNGDKYRTGKTTPDGLPDPSAFSTPQNREGIQVGTAISTLVRSAQPAQGNGTLELRDLWGTGKLAQLARESRNEGEQAYSRLVPNSTLGNPFARRIVSENYARWPRLPELLPISFPGIKTSRDPLVVDIDRDRLVDRVTMYLDGEIPDEEIARTVPIATTDATRFDAKATRHFLVQRRVAEIILAERDSRITNLELLKRNLTCSDTEKYCYRPFDLRWLYWESHTKLLDEKREDYWRSKVPEGLALVSAQSNRRAFDPPCVTRSLASLHVVEKGATIFPLQVEVETLPEVVEIKDNISEPILNISAFASNPHNLFFHSLPVMHTPRYRADNSGALLSDWPRIPLPATADLLARSAALGHRLAELLDAESDVQFSTEWTFSER